MIVEQKAGPNPDAEQDRLSSNKRVTVQLLRGQLRMFHMGVSDLAYTDWNKAVSAERPVPKEVAEAFKALEVIQSGFLRNSEDGHTDVTLTGRNILGLKHIIDSRTGLPQGALQGDRDAAIAAQPVLNALTKQYLDGLPAEKTGRFSLRRVLPRRHN